MRNSPARSVAQRPPPASPERPAVRRPSELGAWLAALAVAAQLVFLPMVAITAAALILIGRLSRWRPHWLLAPGLCGLCWLAGYMRAGYWVTGSWLTGAFWLTRASGRRGLPGQMALLLHPGELTSALAQTSQWLPAYLIAATGEAAIVLWLAWRRSPPAWRPGLVATQRQRTSVRALAIGRTVTRDGCALGVDLPSGRLAAVSWAAAERGVLLACRDEQPLAWPALAAVCAAIRRRKTVLLLDLCDADGAATSQLAALAASLGVPAAQVGLSAGGSADGELEAVIGRAIRRREVIAIRALPGADALPGSDAQQAGNAQSAVAALASVLASLRDLALRGDCLVWIAGCEAADDGTVRSLVALGPATGTAVLLTTAVAETRPFPAVGLVIVADAAPGRFTLHRAAGRSPEFIQAVSCELAAAASS